MTEPENESFPLNIEGLSERLLKKLTLMKLDDFHEIICRRAKPIWRVPRVTLCLQRFLRDKYPSKHARLWAVYKLMLTFDLFSIAELLYFDSMTLEQYIDRFYGVMHWTNDQPLEMSRELLESKYYGTTIQSELEELLGKHCEIKEDSLIKLIPRHRYAIKMYERAKEHIDRLQIHLLKQHIRQGFTTSIIDNSESRFIEMFFKSTEGFSKQGSYFIILLEAEDAGRDIITRTQEERVSVINNDELPSEGLREQVLERINNDVRSGLQSVLKTLAQSARKFAEFSEFTRLTNIAQQIKINSEAEFLQIIELLKFNVVKVLFYECQVRQDEISVYRSLSNLKLIQDESLLVLWKRFHEKVGNLIEQLQKGDLVVKEGFCMQALNKIVEKKDFSKDFSVTLPSENNIGKCFEDIKMIFDEVDLMMVSWICQNWLRTVNLRDDTRTLLIGKTKAGKSSILNFLTGTNSEKIGQCLLSGTFFPSCVKINWKDKTVEAWDLPGLEDTNGKIFKLCVGFFLRTLTVKSQIKVWYLINNYLFLNNRNDYADFLIFLGQLLQWSPANVNCMTFVFSYAAESSQKKAQKEFKKFFEKNLEKKSAQEYEQIYRYIREKGVGQRHEEFEQAVRRRLIKAHTFFYKNDVAKMGEHPAEESDCSSDEENRKESHTKLLMRMFEVSKQGDSYPLEPSTPIKISVDPLTFSPDERAFFNAFNIVDKCKRYLALDQPLINDEMFLKLYRSIREFMQIRGQKIIFEYNEYKKVLQREYLSIQAKFKELNSVGERVKQEKGRDLLLQLIVNWLDIFFEWNESTSETKRQRGRSKLKTYIEKLNSRKKFGVKNILSITDDDVEEAVRDLYEVQQFKYKVPIEERMSLKWLRDITEKKEAEHNLLQLLIEKLDNDNESYAEVQLLSLEHYLVINSQSNERSGIDLNNKMKLLEVREVEHGLQLLRLNCHGQGIYGELRFGQFLEMNAIIEGEVYFLAQPQPIRIYCNKIIFDREVFLVKVIHSLSIVTHFFEIESGNCELDVRKSCEDKNEFATIIVKSYNTPPEVQAMLKIKPGIQLEDLNITKKVSNDLKNQRLQRIIDRGRVMSRTANDDGTYAEKIVYGPPISYLADKFKIVNDGYTIIINVSSMSKQMEFGSLHLASKVMQMLALRKFRIPSTETPADFLARCRKGCSDVINYIIECFSKTIIRMSEEHFDDAICSKIQRTLVPYFMSPKAIDRENMQRDCYLTVKQVIFQDTFRRINKNLQEMYRQSFSRYLTAKRLQDDQRMIKQFCECLLTQPMESLVDTTENHNMMRFAKLFTRDLQKQIFKQITKFEVMRVIKGIKNIFIRSSTHLDNLKRFDVDPNYAESTLKELEEEFRRAMGILQKKTSSPLHTDKASESMNRSKILDSETNPTTVPPKTVDLMTEYSGKRAFSEVVRAYERCLELKSDTFEDNVLLMVAYAYLKLCEFAKARDVLNSVSHFNESREYVRLKRILITLQVKYDSFFMRAMRDTPDNLLKIYEKETHDYLVQPFSPQQIQQSTIRFEQRCDSKAQSTMTILSFDSSTSGNGIVNVLLAAELEKLTHRPALHMFDMICGKNQSAFVASALALHQRGEKSQVFESSFKPVFQAYELIAAYPEILRKLDSNLNMKLRYRELYLKDLIVQLSIVIDAGRPECFSTFDKRTHRDPIYDIMINALGQSFEEHHLQTTNPIYSVWESFKRTPNYQNYDHFEILSFGTGVSQRYRSQDTIVLECPGKTCNVERWQLYIDDQITEKSELFYWDQTRIFMEEKWVGEKCTDRPNYDPDAETKKMRNFIDRLEDRPYLDKLLRRSR